MAKGPNTKSRSLLYAGRGKEEEEEVRNITEARNLGREGEAEKRWAAGPLLLSRITNRPTDGPTDLPTD